jgi:hypothetical protein
MDPVFLKHYLETVCGIGRRRLLEAVDPLRAPQRVGHTRHLCWQEVNAGVSGGGL